MTSNDIPSLKIIYGVNGKHNRVSLNEHEIDGSIRRISELLNMPSLPHMLPLGKRYGKCILYEQWIRLGGERLLNISNTFPPFRYRNKEIYRLGVTRWRVDLTIYSDGDLSSGELNRSKGHINNESVEVFQVLSGEIRMYLQDPLNSSRSYYADLRKTDLLIIPPGWWHSTHVIAGPASVINIVNREGFLDWKEKKYGNQFPGGRRSAYTFARKHNRIVAVGNGEYKKLPKLIKINPSEIPIVNLFDASLQKFCFLAPHELLEQFAFDILSANQKSSLIIPQKDCKGQIIEKYYKSLYEPKENLITKTELKILGITPPDSGFAPMTYFDVFAKLKHINKNEMQVLEDKIGLVTINETVKECVGYGSVNRMSKKFSPEPILKHGYKILKSVNMGGGVAQTFMVIKNEHLYVIKYCDWVGVENNGIQWLRYQAAHLRWLKQYIGSAIPEIYEIAEGKSFFFFAMEYRKFKTLSEILINNNRKEFYKHLGTIVHYLCNYLYRVRLRKLSWIKADESYVEKAYFGRARRRLTIMSSRTALVNRIWRRPPNRLAKIFTRLLKVKYLRINGVLYKNIPEILELFKTIDSRFTPGYLVYLAHGDAYLGNMGIDTNGQPFLFDVRGKLPGSPIDPMYDFGKMAHSFMWDLVRRIQAVTTPIKDLRFENNDSTAIITLKFDFSQADTINKILQTRNHFFEFLSKNKDFRLLIHDMGEEIENTLARIAMAEWINLISDIPNRVEDDKTGSIGLSLYVLGTILANNQAQDLKFETFTGVKVEKILLHPLCQKVFQENQEEIDLASRTITNYGICGFIVQNPKQFGILQDVLIQNHRVIEFHHDQLSVMTQTSVYSKLLSLLGETKKTTKPIVIRLNNLQNLIPNIRLLNDIILNILREKKVKLIVTTDIQGFFLLEAHAPQLTERFPWILTRPIMPPLRNQYKVVVIGASGFLGRAIYDKFKNEGFNVIGTRFTNNSQQFEFLDVTSERSVKKFLVGIRPKPEIIIYAGGLLADQAEYDPKLSLALNFEAIRIIRHHFAGKLIFFSSDQVFGTAERPPYYSYSLRQPITVYGRHKADAENLVLNDSRLIVIRAGVLYGYNRFEDEDLFVVNTLNKLLRNEEIYVDNKRNIFPFSIERAAETVLKLAFSNWSGICAINGDKTTYLEWANILRKVFKVGKSKQIIIGDMNKRTVRPQKAKMVSIDTSGDLVTETKKLKRKIIRLAGKSIDYNLIPAPIDIDDTEFFNHVAEELIRAGAKEMELDVMDGDFTPAYATAIERLQFLKACNPHIRVRVDLMVKEPLKDYIRNYGQKGADVIAVHVASFRRSDMTQRATLIKAIRKIRSYKAKPVLVLDTDEFFDSVVKRVILEERITEVVIMGVTPGIRGESFRIQAFDLVRRLKRFSVDERILLDIAVDGGLTIENIKLAIKAGACIFVSWSMIANHPEGLIKGFQKIQSSLSDYAPNLKYEYIWLKDRIAL